MENRKIELLLEKIENELIETRRGVSVIALMAFWFFSASPILLALILWRVW
tara:strand:+ start:357 stop:509 length:153 start_codon:yes stop_codon:yes gene_type:complete